MRHGPPALLQKAHQEVAPGRLETAVLEIRGMEVEPHGGRPGEDVNGHPKRTR